MKVNRSFAGVLVLAIAGVALAHASSIAPQEATRPGEVVPPVQIVEEVRTLKLVADSFEDLRDELGRDGSLFLSLGSHGLTASRIEVRYEFDAAQRPCRLGRAEVSAHVVVTLPEWVPVVRPTAGQRERWDRWLAALRRHEARHSADAVAAAGELRSGLLAQRPRERCRDLDWDVQRQIDRALLKLDLKGQRYDQATDHGRRTGVEF